MNKIIESFNIKLISFVYFFFVLLLFFINYRNSSFIFLLTLITIFLLCFKLYLDNSPSFIFVFFTLYVLYSIFISEYIFPDLFSVGFTIAKTREIYLLLSQLIFIFIFIFSSSIILFSRKTKKSNLFIIPLINNNIVFFGILFVLILVFIFGVDRSNLNAPYTVRISSYFEYSKLLFIFMLIYSSNRFKKWLTLILVLIFIIQDLLIGGRITSLQIILVVFFGYINNNRLRNNIFILLLPSMIIFANLISDYRAFGIPNNLETIFNILIKNPFFLLDTANYSYYASATHLYFDPIVEISLRLYLLFSNLVSILFGIDNSYSNLSQYISSNVTLNYGGGLLITEYYFFFGIIGVIVFSFLFSFVFIFLINKHSFSKLSTIFFLAIISFSPRWLLYGNLMFIRNTLLVPLFFFMITRLPIINFFNFKSYRRINIK